MTNAEKYQEVFGFPPDTGNCPTDSCKECPCVDLDPMGNIKCLACSVRDWWDEEYKGSHSVKIDITEHHTFAKPDDVSDIKFGDE